MTSFLDISVTGILWCLLIDVALANDIDNDISNVFKCFLGIGWYLPIAIDNVLKILGIGWHFYQGEHWVEFAFNNVFNFLGIGWNLPSLGTGPGQGGNPRRWRRLLHSPDHHDYDVDDGEQRVKRYVKFWAIHKKINVFLQKKNVQ